MNTCVFCEIVAGRTDASVVYRDGSAVGFMDIHTINPGHVLVVPAAHVASLS